MAREEQRRLEMMLAKRPEIEAIQQDKGYERLASKFAVSGLSQYYNSYMENSNNLYREKINQEATYAKSGDDFIKRVDEVVTPQYKNQLLFSQAHGQTASRLPIIASEIDRVNDAKIKDLNASNFMKQIGKQLNTSVDYADFENKSKQLLEQFKATNGDLDAIATRNYQNYLDTAKMSFETERKQQAIGTYMQDAVVAFGTDLNKHNNIDSFVSFIENDIKKTVGDSPVLVKNALAGIAQFAPSKSIIDGLVNKYSDILNTEEQAMMKAKAAKGISNSRYQAEKNLARFKGEIEQKISIGLASTDPDVIGLLNYEQQQLNNFALEMDLSQRSPDELQIIYSELSALDKELRAKIREKVPAAQQYYDRLDKIESQGLLSKIFQGKQKLTKEEEDARETLIQLGEIERRSSYLQDMSNRFYKDFSKDFVEAVESRNPNVSVPDMVIPLVDEKGRIYGKDEFLQSLVGRKTVFDRYATIYQDSEALQHMFSSKEMQALNSLFSKIDPYDALDLGDEIYKIAGEELGQTMLEKATGDIALAQAISMNAIEGATATSPAGTIYYAQSQLKKEDPKRYTEMLQRVDGYLQNTPTLDTSYMDPQLKNKLQWYSIGRSLVDNNGDIDATLNDSLVIHNKNTSFFLDNPDDVARAQATKRIGAYFLDKQDFLNFRQAIKDYKSVALDPNAVWVNNGDSTKSFMLMELGEDNVLRPKLRPVNAPIEWSLGKQGSPTNGMWRNIKQNWLNFQYEEQPIAGEDQQGITLSGIKRSVLGPPIARDFVMVEIP